MIVMPMPVYYETHRRADPCGDCDDGYCTMNCGPAIDRHTLSVDEQLRRWPNDVPKLTVGRAAKARAVIAADKKRRTAAHKRTK